MTDTALVSCHTFKGCFAIMSIGIGLRAVDTSFACHQAWALVGILAPQQGDQRHKVLPKPKINPKLLPSKNRIKMKARVEPWQLGNKVELVTSPSVASRLGNHVGWMNRNKVRVEPQMQYQIPVSIPIPSLSFKQASPVLLPSVHGSLRTRLRCHQLSRQRPVVTRIRPCPNADLEHLHQAYDASRPNGIAVSGRIVPAILG